MLRLVLIFYCALTLYAVAETASPSNKLVFAHYMVCCPSFGTEGNNEQHSAEISLAIKNGIDGFSLNFISYFKNSAYPRVTSAIFRAARRHPNFKLMFSFDRVTAEDSSSILLTYLHEPNLFRHDGRIVVSGWGQTPEWTLAIRQILSANGVQIFLVPNMVYPLQKKYPESRRNIEADFWVATKVIQDSPDLDGFFSWAVGETFDETSRAIPKVGELLSTQNKLYMAGIRPMYRGYGNNFRITEGHGFEGMRRLWEAAINTNVDWIQLITWNDWNESTYLQPFDGPVANVFNLPEWRLELDHSGFLYASRYYIDWFKTGRPPLITSDRFFYFYHLHPKSSEGLVDATALRGKPKFWSTFSERVHFATFLTAPATLRVRIGTAENVINLPAGPSVSSVPASLGIVEVDFLRAGNLLTTARLPLPIEISPSVGSFNYLARELTIH